MDIRELKSRSWKHYASPVGCIHLGCADIGRARPKRGKGWVYTTWGRNLTEEQAKSRPELPVVLNSATPTPTFEYVLEGRILAGILAGIAVNRALFESILR